MCTVTDVDTVAETDTDTGVEYEQAHINCEHKVLTLFQPKRRGKRLCRFLGNKISMASSTVTMPAMSPSSSITGRASRLYSEIVWATSSADSDGCAKRNSLRIT